MVNKNLLKEELDQILTDVANSQEIVNYELVTDLNTSVGEGFVAQFYTGSIKNKDTGIATEVAMKKALVIAEYDYGPIFKNEDIFYTLIFPTLDSFQQEKDVQYRFDNIPKYFCASLEPKKEYIAMENLTHAGYFLWNKIQFFDEEHLKLIFKTYGKFHALSFAFKNENNEKYCEMVKENAYIFSSFFKMDRFLKQMKDSFSAAVNALDLVNENHVYTEVKKYLDDFKEKYLNSRYSGEYSCITHGDCWSNNMLFKYKTDGKLENIKLIDFQLICEGTPVHDLSYFFYSGASKKDFDKLDSYLEIYYESFSEFANKLGGDPDKLYPIDVFKNEWKENASLGVVMAIYLWQIKLVDKEKMAAIMNGEKNSIVKKIKMWDAIMNKMYKSDEFRQRTKSILVHAVEYGIIL